MRRVLFWITVVLFFTTLPIVLMRTYGVEFDRDEERLVQRAAVWVVSRPSGATIVVDGREHDRPTPALVAGLEATEHEIELRLEDHLPWRAIVDLEANRVLELDAAVLMPEEPSIGTLALTGSVPRRFVLGDNLIDAPDRFDAWRARDVAEPGASALSLADDQYADLVVERVDHPPYLDYAMALARDGDRNAAFLVDVAPDGIELDRIDAELPDDARMVWHAPMIGSTFFLIGRRMLVYRSPLGDLSELESRIAGTGYLDGAFYYATSERIVRVTPLGVRTTVTEFSELDAPVREAMDVFLSRGPADVVYADDQTVALLAPDGTLFVHFNGRIQRIAIVGAAGDTDEQRLLLWQRDRFGAVDLRLASANGITDDASRELVTEWKRRVPGGFAEPLAIPEISHVLYRSADALVAEIVAPGVESESRVVTRVDPQEEMLFAGEPGVVVLVNRASATARLIDLVPDEPLLSIERLE